MKKLLLLLLCVPLIGLGNDSINTEIQDAILSIPAEERRQILRGIQFKNSPHLMPQEHSISREKYNEIDRLVDGPFSLNDKSLDERINYLKKEEKKQWFLISFIIIACVLLFFILKKIDWEKIKKLLPILLCFPMISLGQEKISVNDIRNLFSEDFSNNCITVDTIEANPFTGVIYLSYWKDRCEPLKAIMHYEGGYRDGMDIDLAATGEIISVTNWSKGVWAGVQYFNSYANYASKKYRTRFQNNFYNRGASYWSRDELLKGGFIKKTTIDTPHILQFDIRHDNNGVLIYQRYYNAEGKEIPKIQYDKLEYLNK